MNTGESTHLLRRMAATWPGSGKLNDDALGEWIVFLADYEPAPSWGALKTLRESMRWRPSMSEFREAYIYALACADDERKQLPSGNGDGEYDDLHDRYGSNQDAWVYCWRCDMALTLDEFDNVGGNRGYDKSRGMYHRSCPRHGSAPTIPAVERAARDKALMDRKTSIGPNVDPVPYTDVPPKSARRARHEHEVRELAAVAVRRMNGGAK